MDYSDSSTTLAYEYTHEPARIPDFSHYFIRNTAAPHKERIKRIAYLDSWRGMSLLFVLAGHFYGFFDNIGYLGVNCFFVLSGLLMGKILFVDKMPLGTFYRHRIARIFPVFYLYLLVLPLLVEGHGFHISGHDILYSALFLRTYFGGSSVWDGNIVPISHLWSLNIEEHCYILLSLVSLFALSRGERFARIVTTALALLCVGFFGLYKFIPPNFISPPFLHTECAGFALLVSTALFLWLRRFNLSIPSYIPLAACAAGLGIGAYAQHNFALCVLCPFFLAIAINTFEYAPSWLLSIFSNRILGWFGMCSYSIYIWQQIFFATTEHAPHPIRIMGLMMGIAVGAFSYYFYEQPMRKQLRRLTFKRQPA